MSKILGAHKYSTLTSMNVTTLTSGSGTYTTPANVLYLRIRMIAGGGAGGTNTSIFGGAGGGGGGAYGEVQIDSPVATYSYAVGAGGVAIGSQGTGGTGGTSTFGSFSVAGGTGGQASTTNGAMGVPGDGGATPTGFDVNIAGGNGFVDYPGISGVEAGCSGNGAASVFGSGGRGQSANASVYAVTSGVAKGSGGGGGQTTTAGNGAPGIIIIEEHYV